MQATAAPKACICTQQHVDGAATGSGIELLSPPHFHAGPYLRRQRSLCSRRCKRWPHSYARRPVPLQNRPRGRWGSCEGGLKALPSFSRCHQPPPVHSRRLLLSLHPDGSAFIPLIMLKQCTLQFPHSCRRAATRMSRLTLAAPTFVGLQSSKLRQANYDQAVVGAAEVCGTVAANVIACQHWQAVVVAYAAETAARAPISDVRLWTILTATERLIWPCAADRSCKPRSRLPCGSCWPGLCGMSATPWRLRPARPRRPSMWPQLQVLPAAAVQHCSSSRPPRTRPCGSCW
jgi:hypothetical protein